MPRVSGLPAAAVEGIDRFRERAYRHWRQARKRGLARALAEDAARARTALRKYRWRIVHDAAPNAVPVFVVGLQRSGTNMLLRGLAESPVVEVYNEDNPKAFDGFELKSDDIVRALVERSRHRFVAFKCLCDSHRVPQLLGELGTPSHGRAVWIYRSMEGRVRSTLARFPENNRRVLREIAEGRADAHWEGQGLSPEMLELIESFDYGDMTRESGAALMWLARNSLFFDLELDARSDVMLVSYDEFLLDPDRIMRAICDFLAVDYAPRMAAHIARQPPATTRGLDIDPEIESRCQDLERRLDAARAAHGSLAGAGSRG